MLLTEYDEQAHIESEREIALKEGEEIGLRKGEERLKNLMQVLMDAGKTEEINRILSDEEYREHLYKEYNL